jgi:hypothetical protein
LPECQGLADCSALTGRDLHPLDFIKRFSPSHLRFPLFQVLPSAIFTVPTIRFRVLYVFLVLAHDRRRVMRHRPPPFFRAQKRGKGQQTG